MKQRKRRKIRYAQKLRKRMTTVEKVLWNVLRSRQFNDAKFRRQVPMSWYIVDFLCMKHRLIIEVDGSIHNFQKAYDREREEELRSMGFTIVRFQNEDVLFRLPQVLEVIAKHLPSPGKNGGGGRGVGG